MEFTDERIAELEREYRRQERQDSEDKEDERKKEGQQLTFEEILEGVRREKLVLPGKESFTFEVREYFEDRIPMVRFLHFFNGAREEEGVAIFVNHDKEVSQVITVADKAHKRESIDAWKTHMENGMRAVGSFAKVEKSQELNYLDYLSYRTPSQKGWVYSMIFRLRYGSNRVIGNYNCYERDKETMGLILEALIWRMDELLTDREGGNKREG